MQQKKNHPDTIDASKNQNDIKEFFMNENLKKQLTKIANTIRELSMEAVQKANSGHPGLPMGCAEFGAYLYGCVLHHNPENPRWLNRDRFILSAGHGSMLLYACLHLAGFNLSLEEIKQFRQLHSLTPGHPEYGLTAGVEATTGPLGQGIGNAVGQALGLKILADKFNTDSFQIFNSKVYCLAGDGCMMEGISSEASSLAGHLNLNNLVLIYDANKICLDGPISECFSEDVKARYRAYHWEVYELDGYNFDQMEELFSHLKQSQEKPCLIIMHTTIGKGSPHKAGTHKVHGSPLGQEEVTATKKALGLSEEPFSISPSVYEFFLEKKKQGKELERIWEEGFKNWASAHPDLYQEFQAMLAKEIPQDLEKKLQSIEMKKSIASRQASQLILDLLGKEIPSLYGGSADLSGSDLTMMKSFPIITKNHFQGRNIKYGVREFAMAAAATGLAQTQMILPFIGTFLTFSDYMRNAIRLAALSRVQVIYQFTHDSVFLGEDGPTHQPIEHLASLRAIPGLQVIRPADSNEVKMSWIAALKYRGPTALILSRQTLPELVGTDVSFMEGVGRGAYLLKQEKKVPDFTFFATGSEVQLALDTAAVLEKQGKDVRVVSIPSWEIFERQEESYKNKIVGGDLGKRVSLEAGSNFGWHQWIGRDGIAIHMETFGESAPQDDLASKFGFTVEAILAKLLL